jgi:phage terminase large subunit
VPGAENGKHNVMARVKSGNEQWAAEKAAEITLSYEPFPKQKLFHESPAKYRLFGGAAGPGKSKALLMEAVLQANEHPGANTLLLRRTFPELEQSLLLYFRRDIPKEIYRSFNDSKHVVEWWNGSTTRFGYCQSENDVYQYQGAEFLFIGIDELTLFTLRQWQFLTSRNRCPVGDSFPCMAGATNPGNIGHAWVKSLWVDKKAAPGMESAEEYDPNDYDFIAARVEDNPIYAADENYIKTLRSLPSHLKRAFLDGDWDVFAGQYFDRFDYAKHVVRREAICWREWWPRWISLDWGFEHPSAVYWHAAIPGGNASGTGANPGRTAHEEKSSASVTGRQQVVTYREFVTRRTPPRELAREIVARSESGGEREKIEAVYLSPDAFARRTDEASIAEQMGDVLASAGLPRPTPADDDRIGGWMLMYQMLDAGEWLLTDNCPDLIRTLPNLIRDPERIEDAQKTNGDDSADSARYGLKSRYGTRQALSYAPLTQRLAALVTSNDPTVRAIQARKAQLDETHRMTPVPFVRRRR